MILPFIKLNRFYGGGTQIANYSPKIPFYS